MSGMAHKTLRDSCGENDERRGASSRRPILMKHLGRCSINALRVTGLVTALRQLWSPVAISSAVNVILQELAPSS